MVRFFWLFVIVFLSLNLLGQEKIIQHNRIDDVLTDRLNNIYLISGSEIIKYDLSGKQVNQFSNAIYGEINSVDVTNPLRILLFYKASNTIIFLNQQLVEIADAIELVTIGDVEASYVCSSNQGGFWIFDVLSQSVLYFDANRILKFQSQTIGSISQNSEPMYLQEYANNLYLTLNSNQTLVFDQFATYKHKLFEPILSTIKPGKENFAFYNGAAWINYQVLLKQANNKIEPKTEGAKIIQMTNGTILEQTNKAIIIK